MSAAIPASDAPVIVWFRQDLRLRDNPALIHAAQSGRPVLALYILDDQTPGRWAMGAASRWWLHHSVTALAASLEEAGTSLILKTGCAATILMDMVEEAGAAEVVWNRCYEPHAARRDKALKSALRADGIAVRSFNASLLVEPWAVQTKTGGPYRVFTPFWREARLEIGPVDTLPAPKALRPLNPAIDSETLDSWALTPSKPDWASAFPQSWTPGEAGARSAAATFIDERLDEYASTRDRADLAGTSGLSPHLHFGEVSPRQIWSAISHACEDAGQAGAQKFLGEIGWREFSHHLLFHFPDFPEENFQPKFNAFNWSGDETAFKAWTRGQTGYPFVDAGMRQLWSTGWMHNRVRMVTASFLVKHLQIDWRKGQDWFWDTLVDADLANNSAGWQWVAGSGADAAPYFRIFNPITQGTKFDPDGSYVRTWIPELARMPARWIHCPWDAPASVLKDAGVRLGTDYPAPIIDHMTARDRALSAFKDLKTAA